MTVAIQSACDSCGARFGPVRVLSQDEQPEQVAAICEDCENAPRRAAQEQEREIIRGRRGLAWALHVEGWSVAQIGAALGSPSATRQDIHRAARMMEKAVYDVGKAPHPMVSEPAWARRLREAGAITDPHREYRDGDKLVKDLEARPPRVKGSR